MLLLSAVLLLGCTNPTLRTAPDVVTTREPSSGASQPTDTLAPHLKVMTLNLAHGRGEGLHRLLQSGRTARGNLDEVGGVLARERPDLIALQEADGRAFWSGGFDHVGYLARRHAFHQYVQGQHARGLGLAYGTALVSRLPLSDPLAVTFAPEHSTTPKGFVVSAVAWPGRPSLRLDVVSLHLAPLSESVRLRQATELIRALRGRQRPLIVMGDFNTEWSRDGSALRFIARSLALEGCRPNAPGMSTYPAFSKRLDWILVSPELHFVSYAVLPDPVSDHRAVVALVGIGDGANPVCGA